MSEREKTEHPVFVQMFKFVLGGKGKGLVGVVCVQILAMIVAVFHCLAPTCKNEHTASVI